MRKTPAFLTAAAITSAVVLGGCGNNDAATTPDACLDGPQAYREALAAGYASDVRLAGDVKISDCLVRNQPDGDLTDVGDSMRIVATQLSQEMASQPDRQLVDPPYEAQAGYLIGAARLGAEGTDGIHATLIQRIEAAATNNIDTPAEQKLYDQGVEAGQQNG